MLKVKSEVMELRGVANKQSAQGKVYYIVNVETMDGTPHQFYCPDATALPQGLKKGDNVVLTFDVKYYKNQESLVVANVEKAS